MAIDPPPLTDDEIDEALRALSLEKAKRRERKTSVAQIENLARVYIESGGDPEEVEGAVARSQVPKPPSKFPSGTMVEPTGKAKP